MELKDYDNVVLFDGVCNLCQKSIQYLLKADHAKRLKFSSLQSEFGQSILAHSSIEDLSTVVYFSKGKLFVKSDAALHILKSLGGWRALLFYFIFIPRRIRDGVYDWIAARRYNWFGKSDTCWVMTPELQERFI